MGARIITLTHDHDVCVGEEASVPVGGLALIHGAVGRLGVVQHYCVAQNPSVGRRRVCRDTRQTHTHTQLQREGSGPSHKGSWSKRARGCGASLEVHVAVR